MSVELANLRSGSVDLTASEGLAPPWDPDAPPPSLLAKAAGSEAALDLAPAPGAAGASFLAGPVPQDYVDVLLADALVEASQAQKATEDRGLRQVTRMRRYARMHRIALVALCLQASVAVAVALLKTILQPRSVYGYWGELEDFDVVLLLDGSAYMRTGLHTQHRLALRLASELQEALEERRQQATDDLWAQFNRQVKGRRSGLLQRMLGTDRFQDELQLFGGGLRISTGLFNAKRTHLLHGLSDNLADPEEAMRQLEQEESETQAQYGSHSVWLPALQSCQEALNVSEGEGDENDTEVGVGRHRLCVFVGDSDIMCQQQASAATDELCSKFPELCPTKQETEQLGYLFEFRHEMAPCNATAKALEAGGVELGLLMTVASEAEQQMRLRSPSFRTFVEQTTGCPAERGGGDPGSGVVTWNLTGCDRFMSGHEKGDLRVKSHHMASRLDWSLKEVEVPNRARKLQFIFFLLLPVNLLLYLMWARVAKAATHAHVETLQTLTAKGCAVAVTRTLVEKLPGEVPEGFSEVELSEMAQTPQPVYLGTPILLRARLHGGYLQEDEVSGLCNGNGRPSDTAVSWSLRPADAAGGRRAGPTGRQPPLHAGDRLRLCAWDGRPLHLDSLGLRAGDEALLDPDVDPTTTVAEFVAEPEGAQVGEVYSLGDPLRLRVAATGRMLRVSVEDGICDALGGDADADTQFTTDCGGQPIPNGAIVTLRSAATDAYLYAGSDGAISALPAGAEASSCCWRVEMHRGLAGMQLQVGDVITLRCLQQEVLEVDHAGACHWGIKRRCEPTDSAPLDSLRRTIQGDGKGALKLLRARGVRRFVVVRYGTGLERRHDTTIRFGSQICLRPDVPDPDSDGGLNYLQVVESGDLEAIQGAVKAAAAFTIQLASAAEVASPLLPALAAGDVDLLLSQAGEAAEHEEHRRIPGLAAPWTSQADLAELLRGPVAFVSGPGKHTALNEKGQPVPMSFEPDTPWVLVVGAELDLAKESRLAKAKGAVAMIMSCPEAVPLPRRLDMRGTPAAKQPELPGVFVGAAAGEALRHHGVTLAGCVGRTQQPEGLSGVLEGLRQGDAQKVFAVAAKAMAEAAAAASSSSGASAAALAAPPGALRSLALPKSRESALVGWVAGGEVEGPDGDSPALAAACGESFAVAPRRQRLRREVEVGPTTLQQLSASSDFKIEYDFEEVQADPAAAASNWRPPVEGCGVGPAAVQEGSLLRLQVVTALLVLTTGVLLWVFIHYLLAPKAFPQPPSSRLGGVRRFATLSAAVMEERDLRLQREALGPRLSAAPAAAARGRRPRARSSRPRRDLG